VIDSLRRYFHSQLTGTVNMIEQIAQAEAAQLVKDIGAPIPWEDWKPGCFDAR